MEEFGPGDLNLPNNVLTAFINVDSQIHNLLLFIKFRNRFSHKSEVAETGVTISQFMNVIAKPRLVEDITGNQPQQRPDQIVVEDFGTGDFDLPKAVLLNHA